MEGTQRLPTISEGTDLLDNITHTLFALALSRVRPLGRARLAVPMLVVAANLPDVDVVMRVVKGPAGYLEYHRGITHSFAGLALLSVLLAMLARFAEQRFDPRPDRCGPFALESCFPAIVAGLLSHFVLDYAISYGIRPFLPFSPRWYYGDLLFVVDPWLWLLFGGLAALRPRAEGNTHLVGGRSYLALLAVTTAILFAATPEQSSLAIRIAWFPLVGALIAVRRSGLCERRPRIVAGVLLSLTACYFALLVVCRIEATSQAQREIATRLPGVELSVAALLPQPTRPFDWVLVGQSDREIVWLPVRAFAGCGELRSEPQGLDAPELARAIATPGGQAWESFVRLPWVKVLRAGDRTIVRLADARYWYTDFCTVDVELR